MFRRFRKEKREEKKEKKGVFGWIKDEGGEALAGSRVVLEGTDLSLPLNLIDRYILAESFSDDDGFYHLDGASGKSSLLATKKGYIPRRRRVYAGEEPINVDFSLRKSSVEVVAHRGGSAYAPENTLSAFRKAILMGFPTCELDVQLTRDGEVVVVHDELLDRTSNSSGAVRSRTLKDLKRLDFGYWFDETFAGEKIPTLREVLDLCKGKIGVQVELKNEFFSYPGMEEKVVDLLEERHMLNEVMVTSFNRDSIFKMGIKFPGVKLGLLIRSPPENLEEMKYWTYLHAVLPGVSKINHKFVNFAHSNGLKVYCWTANSFGSIKKLIRMDVDGITTDYPLRVYEAIEQEYPELREEEDFL